MPPMSDPAPPPRSLPLPAVLTDPSELTPEQHAALADLAEQIVTHVRVMIDAFDAFAAACVKAQQSMEEMRRDWDTANGFVLVDDAPDPTTDGDTPR